MTNAPKTVLAIHDLPGFGRAALSVIVPVLSTLGVQTVALPTAVLSTHTGGLGTPAKLANPGYGPAALEHYHRLGVKFDCIYSGYLADAAQAKLVEQAFELWPRAFKVVDPVLGDGGRLYSGLGADMVPAMYSLCSKADLIVPNVTEAALLLGDPLPGVGSAEQAAAQAARLTRVAPQVVVTGVTGIGGGRYIGCVGAARGGEGYAVKTPLQPRMFHGTGDIFCRRARRAHFAGQRAPGCRTGSCRLRSRSASSRRPREPTSGWASGWRTPCRNCGRSKTMRLPRDKDVLENARALRKSMTREERHLWYDFLRGYSPRFVRQKVVGRIFWIFIAMRQVWR